VPRASQPMRMPTRPDPGLARAMAVPWILALSAAAALAAGDPKTGSPIGPRVKETPVQPSAAAGDPNVAVRLKDHLSKQVWKSRIGALPAEASGQKDDLENLIERVKAAQLRSRPKGGASGDAGKAQAPADPNRTQAARPAAPAEPANAEPAAAPAPITEGVDANAVTDPFRMAEILFSSGHAKEAAPFYQKALARLDAQDKKTAARRQWILLQLGRCWREDQPAQARQMFSQLISEYPDSPWLELATTWQGLTDWYLTEHPLELVRNNPKAAPAAGAAR
jgi:tetratricopeptide (TPR) repeat protein